MPHYLGHRRECDDASERPATTTNITCNGEDCFGLSPLLPIPEDALREVAAPAVFEVPPRRPSYDNIAASQTRLVQLEPWTSHREELHVRLVTVDLIATEGVRLAKTLQEVQYTALSYVWPKYGPKARLWCDGEPVELWSSLVTALRQHQHSEERRFVWLDGLCIDQENLSEQAAQVSSMFTIFAKATSVTVWLGLESLNSAMAMNCLAASNEILGKLSAAAHLSHHSQCSDLLLHAHNALLDLYERPYLSRTWVRQEMYAARQLIVACGPMRVSWNQYLCGKALLLRASTLLSPLVLPRSSRYDALSRYLDEAAENTKHVGRRYQMPRNPGEVMLRANAYGVAREQDTVYAALGICGIPSTTTSPAWSASDCKFLVDYNQSPGQVYQNFTAWLLAGEIHETRLLRQLWHYRKEPCQSGFDTPSWVMNWRSSRCSDAELDAIQSIEATFDAQFPPQSSCSGKLGADHSSWPTVIGSDHRVLAIRATAWNYVAHVTDYTCTLPNVAVNIARPGMKTNWLTTSGLAIHMRRGYLPSQPLLQPRIASVLTVFDKDKHHRRLVVLGCVGFQRLALAPANTAKGDLIVSLANDVQPLVIGPIEKSVFSHDIYDINDKYDMAGRCRFSRSRFIWMSDLGRARALPLMVARTIVCLVILYLTVRTVEHADKVLSAFAADHTILYIAIVNLACCAAYMVASILCELMSMQRTCQYSLLYPLLTRTKNFVPLLGLQRKNLRLLNSITEKYGPDYVFRGPAFLADCWGELQPTRTELYDEMEPRRGPMQTFYLH